MKMISYLIFKISKVSKSNTLDLTKLNGETLIKVSFERLHEVQSLEAVKKLINIKTLNRKSNGFKWTYPVVHTDKHYTVIKITK